VSGREQSGDRRKYATGIACIAILLAALTAGSHWRRPGKAMGTSLGRSFSALSVRAVHPAFTPASHPVSILHPEKLVPASELAAPSSPSAANFPPSISAVSRARALQTHAALPMTFEANNGQTDPEVKFLAHAPAYTLFLTDTEAVLSVPEGPSKAASFHAEQPSLHRLGSHPGKPAAPNLSRIVRLGFAGTSTPSAIVGRDQLISKTNYFIGNDPKQWHTNVPNYSAVEYRGIYPGVNAIFRGNDRRLEFDFNVAPGADPGAIALEIHGARRMRLNSAGEVVLRIAGTRDLVLGKPHIYQDSPEGRREIAGNFVMRGKNGIGFALGAYDHSQPLVIDPTLIYSTYLGGGISGESYANAIAVDSSSAGCAAGCAIVTGTAGADTVPFPTTAGSYNPGPVPTATNFPFISKLKADGSGLVYSTYFGGTYEGYSSDQIYAIAVDSTGAAYFGGMSGSYDDTPTTPGAFMPVRPSNDPVPFVAKLSPDGSTLVYGTFLDGTPHNVTDGVSGIAVDSSLNAYVTGNTTATDFPTTTGAFQTVFGASIDVGTAFVTKLSPDGSSLIYSTYLGGDYGENVLTRGAGGAIALDSSSDAYVTGDTFSTNFPTKNAYIATCNSPCSDAYVSELNPTGTELVYSTFLGGTTANKDSVGMGIAVDSSNSAFVGGTTSFTNFPVTSDVVQSSPGVGFITKLAPDGTGLVYSSYFNGYVDSVAVGPDESAVLFGYSTTSLPFESTAGAFTLPACVGGGCFFDFLSKFNAEGSELLFSTPIGANLECCGASGVLDPSGTAYIAGSTGSHALPTTTGSFEPTLPSNYTGFTPFVAKASPWSSTSLGILPGTVPSGTAGIPYSQSFSATGGTGTVSFALTAGSLPAGLTLTSVGALSGTPTQVGTFSFTVTAFDTNNDTGSQLDALQIGCPTITVSSVPSPLPSGPIGIVYPAVTFSETGGVGAITFTATPPLPPGMTFVAGVLGGTPSQTGNFTIRVTATDSNSCTGNISEPLTISGPPPPATVTDDETIMVSDTEPFADIPDPETIMVTDTPIVVPEPPALSIAAPVAYFSPGGIGFGTVPSGQTVTLLLSVANIGQAALSLAVSPPGSPFSISQVACTNGATSLPTMLPSTGACVLSISYLASSGTPPNGAITFTDNAGLSNVGSMSEGGSVYTQSIPLLGAGNSTPPPAPPQTTVTIPPVIETIMVTDTETAAQLADSETITVTDTPIVRALYPSAVHLSTSANGSVADGTPVTLTAQVASTLAGAPTTPTGTVTFLISTNSLGSGILSAQGVATLTTSVLPSGVDVITAQYSGDTNFVGSTSPIETVSVNSPDYTLSANPPTLTVAAGNSASTMITVAPDDLFLGSVIFSCGTLPSYITCTFTPSNTITFPILSPTPQTLTLTVAVAKTTTTAQQTKTFILAMVAPIGLLALLPMVGTTRKRLWAALLLAMFAFTAAGMIAGCGGGSANLPPVGSQNFFVTAAGSGNISHQLQLTIDITN
jgi:hypothetical protein